MGLINVKNEFEHAYNKDFETAWLYLCEVCRAQNKSDVDIV